MSEQPKSLYDQVRAVFTAAPQQAFTFAELRLQLTGTETPPEAERCAIAGAVKYLTSCGFLVKDGQGTASQLRASGQDMKLPRVTPEQRVEKQRAKSRRQTERRKAQRGGLPAARGARVDARAGMMPKPVLAAPKAKAVAETVEQFLARGGRVQRLVAHWEQMERAA